MFDVERFIEACRGAIGDGLGAVRELVAEAMADPSAVASALGDPEHAGIVTLHRSLELTVLDFTWAPWMCLKPHNHNMWSVIGIFSGREDNVFWKRTSTSIVAPLAADSGRFAAAARSIEAAGARSLGRGDIASLGPDVIHSVTNPIGKMTRAIHVYGGDFFAPPRPRSEWDHETLVERPWDLDGARRAFADAEARASAKPGTDR